MTATSNIAPAKKKRAASAMKPKFKFSQQTNINSAVSNHLSDDEMSNLDNSLNASGARIHKSKFWPDFMEERHNILLTQIRRVLTAPIQKGTDVIFNKIEISDFNFN